MELAKPALDVGLYTNQIDAQLKFWQQDANLTFAELLKVGGGVHQHRHAIGESVLKVNSVREQLPSTPASGLHKLHICRPELATAVNLQDPDGNELVLQPSTAGIGQLRLDLIVSNLEQHREFYGGLCGFNELGGDLFGVGDSQIALQAGDIEPNPEQRALGFRYMTVQVFDVKAEHAKIVNGGGREGIAPVKLGAVAHISFVRDPDGNWIEISQRKSITGSLD